MLYRAAGCKACRQSGFSGRVGIYELLILSDTTRELVMARQSGPQIATAATQEGKLTTLREDAFEKVRQGITSLEEALRAVAT
ncbi:MAG TPA: hypothetical protein ENJ00_07995 [Phycisphaerales bacterium]|nr:hypothetical protein [Phycisphaerales bacterium]